MLAQRCCGHTCARMPANSDDAAAAAGSGRDGRCSRFSLALGAMASCVLLVVAMRGAPLLQRASCAIDMAPPAATAAVAAFDPLRSARSTHRLNARPSCRVLSNDLERYTPTAKLLRDVGLGDCPRIEPLAPSSPLVSQWIDYVRRLHRDERPHAGIVSNMLSFAQAWAEFGAEPGHSLDWRIFFEDDVVLSVNVSASEVAPHVARLHELAAPQGFALLGVCTYGNGLTPTFVKEGRWEFRRGSGRCAHAYSMTRWRAASLWDLMQSVRFLYINAAS